MKFTGLRSSGILVDSESTDCDMDHEALPQDYKNRNNGGEREASLMELPASWVGALKMPLSRKVGFPVMQLFWGHLCSCK